MIFICYLDFSLAFLSCTFSSPSLVLSESLSASSSILSKSHGCPSSYLGVKSWQSCSVLPSMESVESIGWSSMDSYEINVWIYCGWSSNSLVYWTAWCSHSKQLMEICSWFAPEPHPVSTSSRPYWYQLGSAKENHSYHL